MTGQELRTKAINGARGVVSWGKLSAAEKGMWNNAALELQHEADKMLGVGLQLERMRVLLWLRTRAELFFREGDRAADATGAEAARTIAKICIDSAERLELNEHT